MTLLAALTRTVPAPDLKPRNILLLDNGNVILCDLDASMKLGDVRAADEKVRRTRHVIVCVHA